MQHEFVTFENKTPQETGASLTIVALIQNRDCRKYLAELGKFLVISGVRCTYPF